MHHPCRFWNTAEKKYNAGNWECRGLMRALKKFCNYVYGIQFLETDANTLVYLPQFKQGIKFHTHNCKTSLMLS